MNVVALYSVKGGVGKSTNAANLAARAAASGRRTLLVDLDAQGASSYTFRVRPTPDAHARGLLDGGEALVSGIRGSDHDRLDVLPAHTSYRHLERLLDAMKRRRRRLDAALGAVDDAYDLVVLDAPPGLSLLGDNLFRAADLVLVPVVPTPLCTRTWPQLVEAFLARGHDPAALRPFWSMLQRRSKRHQELTARLQGAWPLLDAAIPLSADLERMAERREPVTAFAPRSLAGRASRALCDEVLGLLDARGAAP